MRFLYKKIAPFVIAVSLFCIPVAASAALVNCGNEDTESSSDGCKFTDLFGTANNLINYLLSGAAVVAVGGVVYGGYLMVTSAGNQAKQGEGKKAVTNSVIGLVVILVAFVLVRTVFIVLGYKGGASPLENPQEFINSGPNLLEGGSGNPPPAQ